MARRETAHEGRMGGNCIPRAIVVHTTDTYPGAFKTMVRSWTQMAGGHNCAHLLLGRTPEDGLVQFVSLLRNSNHAGGVQHGWWREPTNALLLHPNTYSIGIEIDSAGYLKLVNGKYIHPDTKKEIPSDEVMMMEGKAWHLPTEYQLATLHTLIEQIRTCTFEDKQVFNGFPLTYKIVPDGPYRNNGVAWASCDGWRSDIVGHVTLDPINRLDPGPYILNKLKEWYPTVGGNP